MAAGQPDLSEPPPAAKLSRTPPLDLPTDANALYDHLKREASAPGDDNPLNLEMFTLVGDSLRETAATPAQRAALYQVAARLPGIELLGSIKDSAGRPGIGVAMSNHGIRFTLAGADDRRLRDVEAVTDSRVALVVPPATGGCRPGDRFKSGYDVALVGGRGCRNRVGAGGDLLRRR